MHHALNCNSEFVLDIIEGGGLTGLYSVCGYTVGDPELDTQEDENLGYVTEQLPIPKSLYVRKKEDFQKYVKAIVRCAGVMMNQVQLHHIDFQTNTRFLHQVDAFEHGGQIAGTCDGPEFACIQGIQAQIYTPDTAAP